VALRVRSQVDATDTATAGGYLTSCAAELVARQATLKARLAAAGLRVMVWRPEGFGDEGTDARGRFQEVIWGVLLGRTAVVPLPPDPGEFDDGYFSAAGELFVTPDGAEYYAQPAAV
jgi:hypothetical protein